MIGLIQRVLIDHIEATQGEAAMRQLAAAAGVEEPGRRIDTDYDDAECLRLFEAAGQVLGLDREALMALYADIFVKWTLVHYPMFFQMADSAQAFLARQPAIHASMGAGIRDAQLRARVNDKFRIVEQRAGRLVVEYRSDNGLCGLYRALFQRLLDHYEERGLCEEACCMHRGDTCCRFVMHFEERPA
ncbi:heme NO-binding domain-containing protein [Salinicola sp. JS01]|uniref:heme NO-binding domain-containing protein n=1 Tax=Salinicola sp. JS01 TaxID=3050071 RepID=UPI00255B941E|nr:heme NO-binding domain-containing protein [Salinicola sp. JS01]WIX31901.1 heme NO-binding domain-containing protein [Salinicola sp. JS01]